MHGPGMIANGLEGSIRTTPDVDVARIIWHTAHLSIKRRKITAK
jgi:hypothetical protein